MMIINIYDSFSRQRKEWNLNAQKKPILIYLCGPTLSGPVHIGNLRPIIFADLLVRFFKKENIDYCYIQSITDISEKIHNVSVRENVTEQQVANKFLRQYQKVLEQIGVINPTMFGRPSNYLVEIGKYIRKLITRGVAYEAEGNVFFRINSDTMYGSLSHKDIARTILSANKWTSIKEDPRDFTLWKAVKNEKRIGYKIAELAYGRPGWHIECSVMATELLNQYKRKCVDFCIGGQDLIFPHHENMLAQHRGIYDCSFTKFWINVGQILWNERKMAKSTHNFLLASDYLQQHSADSLRYLLFKAPYQKPLNVSHILIGEAEKKVDQWRRLWKSKLFQIHLTQNYHSQFYCEKICDNFNTNQVFFQINNDVKLINKNLRNSIVEEKIIKAINELNYAFYLLGFTFAIAT